MKVGKLVKVRGADSHKAPPWLALRPPGFLRPWMKVDMGFCLVAQP